MKYSTLEEDMVSMLMSSISNMGLSLKRYPLPSADVKIVASSNTSSPDANTSATISDSVRAANFQQAANHMVLARTCDEK